MQCSPCASRPPLTPAAPSLFSLTHPLSLSALSVSISAFFSFYAWCPPFVPAYSFSCSRRLCWRRCRRRWHFIIAASSMESALNYGQQTDWGGSTRLGSVSHDLVGVVRECLQVQPKLSRSGATPAAAAEAVEAAAAAAAHVSLVNALRCQLSLNKHSNAPANGRHTWLHFQQKSTPTPDTLTHVFTVALTFTSIFTSSLPSTRNVNSVDSTHLSELRSSRRAPHPNPSFILNPSSSFSYPLPLPTLQTHSACLF